jgi:hypothetical protein
LNQDKFINNNLLIRKETVAEGICRAQHWFVYSPLTFANESGFVKYHFALPAGLFISLGTGPEFLSTVPV